MNSDQLIRMLTRMFVNRGLNKGIDALARRGKNPEDMTQQEKQQAQSARKNAHNARRLINTMRRFTRF